jgi:hypothetical protein
LEDRTVDINTIYLGSFKSEKDARSFFAACGYRVDQEQRRPADGQAIVLSLWDDVECIRGNAYISDPIEIFLND